jgi:hypothetical protein
MLVGHQPCSTCRGGHTTWTCLDCGGVAYGPALTADCRILVGAAGGALADGNAAVADVTNGQSESGI